MSGLKVSKVMRSHRAEGVTMAESEKRRANEGDQEVHNVLLFSFVKSHKSDSLKSRLAELSSFSLNN